MPTNQEVIAHQGTPVADPLSLRELTEVLIKHYGIHEGQYDLLVEFKIGVGALGPNQELALPGAMVGVSRLGLVKSTKMGNNTVDAAEVNPVTKARKKD
ncbi:hypothetical protein [Mangrovitalea sediminis]|uniref:hypothetical protein n=1 Tax=Mangrovitalea sediminis TaxID=1982043 RepID=UPI000BE4FBAB|nr:hypothetical protein [Mangrovitalea sediminis]